MIGPAAAPMPPTPAQIPMARARLWPGKVVTTSDERRRHQERGPESHDRPGPDERARRVDQRARQ